MTYFEALRWARSLIHQHHLELNAAAYLMQRRLGWSNLKLLMHYRDPMSRDQLIQYRQDVHQYLGGRPPQYIIGTAPFYGYNFWVNRHVLIPRPETEGLVYWLLCDAPRRPVRVLDLGTGSGAIAIALKLRRPRWQITATDVSAAALRVARANAQSHRVQISFRQTDLFNNLPHHYFDFIISNPPYVAKNEIKYMDSSVINYEPHLALFARDHGLMMYKRIARSYLNYLTSAGSLYLEIGFRQKAAVSSIFKLGHRNLNLVAKRDLAGHFRMVRINLK